MKQWYRNLSIRSKMVLVNYIIIVCVAFAIGIAAYVIYRQTIVRQLSALNLKDVDQIGESIEQQQSQITELASFLGSDHVVQRILGRTADEQYQNLSELAYVRYQLNNLLVSYDYVNFVQIYTDNGFAHYAASDLSFNVPDFETVKGTRLYQAALAEKGAPVWAYIPQSDQTYMGNNGSDKLMMFKVLLDLGDYQPSGLMMISLDAAKIRDLYDSLLLPEGSLVFLLDETNRPMISDSADPEISADPAVFLTGLDETNAVGSSGTMGSSGQMGSSGTMGSSGKTGMEIQKINGQDYIRSYHLLERTGWKLVNVVPLASFMINLELVPVVVVVVFILALLLGLVFTNATAGHLTKPIKNLLVSIGNVKQGNFQENVPVKSSDEIGELTKHYNEMIAYINNLLNQVYALEIEEKIAELKALQAQINPHFLYNTLDNIYWKAAAGDTKGVQDMVLAMSKLFRLVLNVGKEFSSVRQEKELIQYYITLQQQRYRSKLTYHVDFSEEILDYEIPKLILQPFVENAIVHGIETEARPTEVTVTGSLVDEKLKFTIRDTGKGISQETVAQLLEPALAKDASPDRGGYGIKNVIKRLSLYYENHYDLSIRSTPGQGTEVVLTVPRAIPLTKLTDHEGKHESGQEGKNHVETDHH